MHEIACPCRGNHRSHGSDFIDRIERISAFLNRLDSLSPKYPVRLRRIAWMIGLRLWLRPGTEGRANRALAHPSARPPQQSATEDGKAD